MTLLVALPGLSRADRAPGLSLAEMARRAGVAFAGTVEQVEPDRLRGLPVTRVTFRVSEGLKGASGERVVLTMLGGELPGRLGYRVAGLPVFAAGQDWVLLAYPPSEIGLSAPVGLYRGAFRVVEHAGRRTVLRAGPVEPGAPAAEGYGAFMDRLRALLAGAGPAAPAFEPVPVTAESTPAGAAAPGSALRGAPAGDDAADLAAAAAATGRERRP